MVNVINTRNRQPLERLTVNLVPAAQAALAEALELTRDSKTDTVNRALQIYTWILKNRAEDGSILIADAKGALQQVLLL